MAESHVVSGLISKRAELLGEIEAHKVEIQRIVATLSHIDHTIKLFSPEFDLRTIKAKRTNQRNPYFARGERLCCINIQKLSFPQSIQI